MEYVPKSRIGELSIPKVSVCVQTFQHAPFIGQCLESIVMQKTNFPFEIIVGEDESKDGTRDICLEYAEKYPDKIRLFLRSRKDVMIIYGRPTGRFNFLENQRTARGKYIAFCEGDDYWIDPLKLQKQYDFMEANPDFAICMHNAKIYSERKKEFIGTYADLPLYKKVWREDQFSRDHIIKYWKSGPTASFFFLNHTKEFPEWMYRIYGGDTGIIVLASEKGKAKVLNEVMSVYRTDNPASMEGLDRKQLFKVFRRRTHESFYLMTVFEKKYSIYFLGRVWEAFVVFCKSWLRQTLKGNN